MAGSLWSGALILSRSAKGNWSHWSVQMLEKLRQKCGFSVPLVAETRQVRLSGAMIQVGRLIGKSLLVFIARKLKVLACLLMSDAFADTILACGYVV